MSTNKVTIMVSWLRRITLLLLMGALGTGAWWWYTHRTQTPASTYRTVPLKRGELVATIGATGTVEPEELVDVGAQVAGKLDKFGKDLAGKTIDFGSYVEKDMLLALIDNSLPKLDVATAQAMLNQARGGVVRAEAEVAVSKGSKDLFIRLPGHVVNQRRKDFERAAIVRVPKTVFW